MDFTVPGGGWSSTAGSGTEVGDTDGIKDLGSRYRILHAGIFSRVLWLSLRDAPTCGTGCSET